MKQKSLLLYISCLLFACTAADAQVNISGKVVDGKGLPIRGANIYLNNTIDGGTSDSLGNFSFSTTEKGEQNLVANDISHQPMGLPLTITHDTSGIILRMTAQVVHDLDNVVITAGSFDASNDKTKTVLKPLDIVTIAGSGADVVKAIQVLPGTQQTGTDNGLLVRGGDASEASILVDEMVIQNAFFSGPPGVSTRSRFGAFSYQGVSFSSGGYSARYGQALSGVLELNSTDLPDKSNLNLGASMGGVYASGVKKWKKSAIEFGANYTNLAPFYGIAATNFKFYEVPQGGSGNLRYVWLPNKSGILKVGVNGSFTKSGIGIPNPFAGTTDTNSLFYHMPDTINFVTKDQYYFAYISYKQMFKAKYSLYTAASYSYDYTDNKFGTLPLKEKDDRAQFRIEGKRYLNARMNFLVGTDVQNYGVDKTDYLEYKFRETQASAFAEMEWTPIHFLALKPGLRYEHSALLNSSDVAPRLSMAIKTGSHSQVSIASGIFYQSPGNNYLLAGKRPGMQQATHLIANWQYIRNDRTLRIEGYYKNYQDLVREVIHGNYFDPNKYRAISDSTVVNNSGYGYAQGLELFYRDKKTVKNGDFWISYSYIDTRRLYQNFPSMATPTFIANHNLNLVGKYFVDKWQTNFSATYSFASGYPYFNPLNSTITSTNFLSDKTPTFNNVAVTVAYLHSFGKWFTVFYLSVDNVLNTHNVFGYRYSYDSAGRPLGDRSPIVPALYRTVFAGVNMSLSQFKKDEL